MKMKEMVALNNKRREQLTEENKVYYGDLLVYLRTSKVSQRQVEELALEVLDHIIEAQEKGQSAEEVFGVDLKGYCEELVESLPGNTVMIKVKRFVYLTIILLTFNFLADAISGFFFPSLFGVDSPPTLSPLYVINIIACIAAVEGILFVVNRSAFDGNLRKYSWGFVGIAVGCYAVPIGLALIMNLVVEIPKITFSPWLALLFACMGFVIFKFGMKNIEI